MRLPKGGHQNGGRGRRTSGLKQNRENASEGSLSRHTETLNYRPAAEEVTVILQGATKPYLSGFNSNDILSWVGRDADSLSHTATCPWGQG